MSKSTRGSQTFSKALEDSQFNEAASKTGALASSAQQASGGAANEVSAQAIGGVFSPAFGVLTALGDSLNNDIEFSRDAAGNILINEGAVNTNGSPTVVNTSNILAFGQAGDDAITLDETNGALPKATMFGGRGNDSLTGGSGNDQLFGQSGNDNLLGKGGSDSLFGGSGDDVLTGGDGDDRMFGEGGNDRMIWNPGDDSDLMEGGAGIDTAETNGGDGAETFTITENGSRIQVDRVDPAPFSLDIGTTENVVINANGGDDTITASGNLVALASITIDGGAGNDRIESGNGNDTLLGGEGNDFIDGNQGNDTAFMGAGDDVFQWDPGDGSDVVEGQEGYDTMLFNGSGGNEVFDMSANGERLRFFRDLGNITMDTNDVEVVDLKALGGTDAITVGDMSGTDVKDVRIDLAGTIGGTEGDALSDTITTAATNGDDAIDVSGTAAEIAITGLAAGVKIQHSEAGDALTVNGQAGNDTMNASTLDAAAIKLTMDGGAGDDRILGGRGNDTLLGGDGNDFIDGNQGDDTAFMGAGDDVFQWDPGDGSDVVEGQDGTDTLLFNGANVAENIDISANGERARFFRDVANINMDTNDVERMEFNALGGADNIVVNDMSGTDVGEVAINLAAAGGAGDAEIDNVTATGTSDDDVAAVFGSGSNLQIAGLAAQISIAGAEGGLDTATITALAGDDVIDASGVDASAMRLVLEGGDGDDVLIGSAGADVLRGGAGDDVLIGGTGNDVLEGGDGDDLFIAGSGDIEINGFLAGAGSEDRIDVSQFGVDLDGLLAHANQVNSDVVFDLGTSHLTLNDVSLSALHQDDFLV